MLEQHSHELHGVLDASLGSLLRLQIRPLCHKLQGDLGVPAPEACQHIHCHRHYQGMDLYLQLAADDLL
jgi:hypothetical protein